MTYPISAIEAIEEAMEGVTPGRWKAVSSVNLDNGLTYVSVQPETAEPERDKSLAMASGEYHVCRMSHSAARWRISQYEANARFIAACNPVAMREVLALARRAEALERENAAKNTALNAALVAMRIASALPGVSDEYDFSEAIRLVDAARSSSARERLEGYENAE